MPGGSAGRRVGGSAGRRVGGRDVPAQPALAPSWRWARAARCRRPAGRRHGGGGSSARSPPGHKWRSTGPLAQPSDGWYSLRDFTTLTYNGKHLLHATASDGKGWKSMTFSPFANWSDMATATQTGASAHLGLC
ncbi:non-reducing end alpha-L-arabinofuranosidase family hydrolase [Streptomyces canus]|uniref:non-reducing end alpha-L-arabinofuranosidase family hydrolase n=1 Tax=Streptomyces canus TaxID=58343 RepID=UPI0033CADE10